MGKIVLAVLLALIVGVATLGFTCWLGLAFFALTVGQPSEAALKTLLVVALLVAISLGGWIGRRIALKR